MFFSGKLNVYNVQVAFELQLNMVEMSSYIGPMHWWFVLLILLYDVIGQQLSALSHSLCILCIVDTPLSAINDSPTHGADVARDVAREFVEVNLLWNHCSSNNSAFVKHVINVVSSHSGDNVLSEDVWHAAVPKDPPDDDSRTVLNYQPAPPPCAQVLMFMMSKSFHQVKVCLRIRKVPMSWRSSNLLPTPSFLSTIEMRVTA